jgi:hypothetical protein
VAVHYHRTRRRLGGRYHRGGEAFRVPVEHVDADIDDGGYPRRWSGRVLDRDAKPEGVVGERRGKSAGFGIGLPIDALAPLRRRRAA